MDTKIKKVKQKELAEYLKVSVSAIKQYRKDKRELMLIGLYYQLNQQSDFAKQNQD